MANNDSETLAVELQAKIDDFEKSFNSASSTASEVWSKIETRGKDASKRISDSMGSAASSVVKSLGGIGDAAAAVGAVGFTGMLAAAIKINGELATMADLAKRVGLSTDRLQELQFAAQSGGISSDTFNSGLEEMAKRLNDSRQDESELTKLFVANGIAIKNNKGELISVNDALTKGADLIKNAKTELDKIKIADMLGLSKEWIRTLEQGGEAWTQSAAGARESGAIIDADLIQRADAFDRNWTRVVAQWKAGFKSAANEILPLLDTIAETAAKAAPILMRGISLLSATAHSAISGLDALSLDELKMLDKLTEPKKVGDLQLGDPGQNAKIKERIALLEKMGATESKLRLTIRPAGSNGTTVIPKDKKDDDKDKDVFTRAEDTAKRRIATLEADTQAVGQNEAARERLRTVAQLEQAAIRANRDAGKEDTAVTDEQRTAINKLADATEKAALAQDQAKRKFEALNSVAQYGGNELINVMDGLRTKTMGWRDALNGVVNSLIHAVEQGALLGTGPLAGIFGTASTVTGGTGGIIGALLGTGGGTSVGKAGGGFVRGPGTATSDSIHARLSDGEFVVRASEASKHAALLSAINEGRVARFADGGAVGAPRPIPTPAGVAIGGAMAQQNNHFEMHVHGSPGTANQNQDMADRMGKMLEQHVTKLQYDNARRMMKPGGILYRPQRP